MTQTLWSQLISIGLINYSLQKTAHFLYTLTTGAHLRKLEMYEHQYYESMLHDEIGMIIIGIKQQGECIRGPHHTTTAPVPTHAIFYSSPSCSQLWFAPLKTNSC